MKTVYPGPLPPPGYNNTNLALILPHSSGPFPSRSQDFGRISRHFYWPNHQETHLQPGRYSCLLQRETGLITGFPQKLKTQFHDFSMIFHDQQCNFHDLFNARLTASPFSGSFTMQIINAETVMYVNKHACRLCMHFEIIKT